jgi:hypothetical protein
MAGKAMKHVVVHFTELEAKALLAGLKILTHPDFQLDKSILTAAMKRAISKVEYAEMRFGGEKWLKRHGFLDIHDMRKKNDEDCTD